MRGPKLIHFSERIKRSVRASHRSPFPFRQNSFIGLCTLPARHAGIVQCALDLFLCSYLKCFPHSYGCEGPFSRSYKFTSTCSQKSKLARLLLSITLRAFRCFTSMVAAHLLFKKSF